MRNERRISLRGDANGVGVVEDNRRDERIAKLGAVVNEQAETFLQGVGTRSLFEQPVGRELALNGRSEDRRRLLARRERRRPGARRRRRAGLRWDWTCDAPAIGG